MQNHNRRKAVFCWKIMNTIELTKKLISIPSYLGTNSNEVRIANFLRGYCKKFSWMEIITQPVKNGRFNLIIKDKYPTKFIVCGHLDTVEPRAGWKTDQFKGMIAQKRLYGLGATDMKGNISAFINALSKFRNTQGLMLLLYADEEYDFLGMKKFIEEYGDKLKPKIILSLDGKELAIGNGCRGLIDVACVVKGKTGHGSMPQSGLNAITKSVNAVKKMSLYLSKNYSDKDLRKTTCNLAFLQGGLDLRKNKKDELIIGKEGNNIPDIAEFVLDIRPASQKINASLIRKLLKKFFKEEPLKFESFSVRHDFNAWQTNKNELSQIAMIISKVKKVKFMDANRYGFIDIQMLWKVFGKVPCFTFGAGNAFCAHAANEYIEIDKLNMLEAICKLFIEKIVSGERI